MSLIVLAMNLSLGGGTVRYSDARKIVRRFDKGRPEETAKTFGCTENLINTQEVHLCEAKAHIPNATTQGLKRFWGTTRTRSARVFAVQAKWPPKKDGHSCAGKLLYLITSSGSAVPCQARRGPRRATLLSCRRLEHCPLTQRASTRKGHSHSNRQECQ
jgi:hypothetical protein